MDNLYQKLNKKTNMHGATIKILFIIFYQFCSKTECPTQKLRNKSLQGKKNEIRGLSGK